MNTLAQLTQSQLSIVVFFSVMTICFVMTILVCAFFRGCKDIPDDLVVKKCKEETATHAEIVAAQNAADGIVMHK